MLPGTVQANEDEIVIGAGDQILIDVYNERDLLVRAKVGKSGILRIPLIGDINVIGKSPKQLADELEAAYLDGYLVSPSVSVIIEKFRPFYVRGAVRRAGAFTFEFGMTVEQAIAVAGGLKDRASDKKWFILRGTGKERIKANKETKVLPGDILTIEESIF